VIIPCGSGTDNKLESEKRCYTLLFRGVIEPLPLAGHAAGQQALQEANAVDEMRSDDSEPDEKPVKRPLAAGGQAGDRQVGSDAAQVGARQPGVDPCQGRAQHQAEYEERRQHVGQAARCGGEALGEEAAVQSVASDLPQMRTEERAPMVGDRGPRVVHNAPPKPVNDLGAEDGVLARPIRGVESAQIAQHVGANDEIAARQVVHRAHPSRPVSVHAVAGNKPICINGTSQLRQPGVVRRRDAGTAYRRDAAVGEIGNGVCQPVGIGDRVVIQKRDEGAARLAKAPVALLRGADMAGRNDAQTGCRRGFKRGGEVGEHQGLDPRIRLPGDARKALVEIRREGGACDDDRHQR